ncbi:MAG: DUF2069 domain-containing protein [Burkholderiales bacterium]
MTRILYHGAWSTVTALIVLTIAWELWLAPLRPGGSWLVLKAVPLVFAVRGLLHARRYTYQWMSLLVLAYFAEGIVRAWSEAGLPRLLASIEVVLAISLFLCAAFSARASRSH